jgi:hypothetical protein
MADEKLSLLGIEFINLPENIESQLFIKLNQMLFRNFSKD